MKSKKGHKGETNPVVKVPDLMNKSLLTDIRSLIFSARRQVAQAINAGLTMLYWEIGRRIRQNILHNDQADYGEEIVATLSRQLTVEYDAGFSRPFGQLFRNETLWFKKMDICSVYLCKLNPF
jgi:hypothetical protein